MKQHEKQKKNYDKLFRGNNALSLLEHVKELAISYYNES